MQLNVTTDYGIRSVLYLAQKENFMSSSNEICEKMGIPPKYMHKIAKILKDAKIIAGVRGTKGGFMLKCSLKDLSLWNIVCLFEKTMNLNRCLEPDKFCSRDAVSYCAVRKIYDELQHEMFKRLDIKISTFLEA